MRLLPCKSSRCGAFDTAVLAAMTASFSSRTIFHKVVEGQRSRRRWLQKEILLSSASSTFLMKTVQLSPSSQGFGPPRVLSLMSQKCFSILNGPLALCSLPCLLLLRIRSPWKVTQWSHSVRLGRARGEAPTLQSTCGGCLKAFSAPEEPSAGQGNALLRKQHVRPPSEKVCLPPEKLDIWTVRCAQAY